MLISLFVMVNELPVYGLFLFITNPDRLLTGFHLQVRVFHIFWVWRDLLNPFRTRYDFYTLISI